MRTLLLHPRHDDDSQLVWQAAINAGWRIYRPSRYDSNTPMPVAGDVALYGGWMWGLEVAKFLGLELITPPDDWLVSAPSEVTQRSIRMVPGAELANLQYPQFLKSVYGKAIEARVYHSPDDVPPHIGDGEMFIVQEPVRWLREYRAFVLDGRVLTVSRYATNHELDVGFSDDGCLVAQGYLESCAFPRISNMPRAHVIDVGELRGRGWAVVEPNPAWCSGVYGCDPTMVLEVVAASCMTPGNARISVH